MTAADGWVAFREENGWHLYQPLTGVMIRPNSRARSHWVERVTPEDRDRLDDSSVDASAAWACHITDAESERSAEQFILALATAVNATRLTDHAGRLLNDGPAQALLMEDDA